jgi:hypothetical protein
VEEGRVQPHLLHRDQIGILEDDLLGEVSTMRREGEGRWSGGGQHVRRVVVDAPDPLFVPLPALSTTSTSDHDQHVYK